MRRHRNVKIVATLGPASSTYEMIRALHEAGADVFRLNMSHGGHDEIRARHAIIRQVEKDVGSPIAILADLQGPKLRVGVFAAGSAELIPGAAFRLDLDPAPAARAAAVPARHHAHCAVATGCCANQRAAAGPRQQPAAAGRVFQRHPAR